MMADRSTNKNIRNSVTSDDIISKKMKPNTERLDMLSTATSTSGNPEHELIVTTNCGIQDYNHQCFKQVSLQNTFNKLHHKYKKTDVRHIFSKQEIGSTIQHVVSKVKEFTVLAYAED